MTVAISAVYRPSRARDWDDVEIVADHPSGQLVLREVGKFYRGVFLAPREHVRIAGPEIRAGREEGRTAMSWQEVTPVIGGAAGTMKRLVRYRVSKKFGGAVTVPASVVGALGWKVDDRLSLFVGGGDHDGKLRIAKAKEGLLTLRKNKGEESFQVNLGRVPQLPEREVDRVVVEHEASDGALVICLPPHARAIAPASLRVPAAASSPGSKVNVVDQVVGPGPKPPRYAAASGVRGG